VYRRADYKARYVRARGPGGCAEDVQRGFAQSSASWRGRARARRGIGAKRLVLGYRHEVISGRVLIEVRRLHHLFSPAYNVC
jgi:hypothetical protein